MKKGLVLPTASSSSRHSNGGFLQTDGARYGAMAYGDCHPGQRNGRLIMLVRGKNLSLGGIEHSPEIQCWLSQFPPERRLAAISLLMHLRFIPRDEYSAWLRDMLEAFSARGVCGVYSVRKKVTEWEPLWDEAGLVVGRPGTSLGSEDLVYSIISNARSNARLLDHPNLAMLRSHRVREELLIDDSIGSGERVSDFIRGMMAHSTFRSWWSFGVIRLHIISLARTRESEKTILDATPGSDHGRRFHPKSSKVSFEGDIVYSRDWLQGRWGDGWQAVRNLCDSQSNAEGIPPGLW